MKMKKQRGGKEDKGEREKADERFKFVIYPSQEKYFNYDISCKKAVKIN